ncbi:MAG: diacylglycerol kinase family lipid kinase [Trueperaceae bacterium]
MIYLVYNPVAGRGRAALALERTRAFLDDAAAPYTFVTTSGPGHATALTRAAPPGATVVAMGGDGTVHEVVRGILQCGTRDAPADKVLATLPVGSGDDFAFAMGIPRDDLDAALRRLVAGTVTSIDVGDVNGEPFVNAFGVGFDAEVAHRVAHAPRFLKGLAAYLYAVVTTLGRLDPSHVQVTIDGEEAYVGKALLVGCQNGPRTGGSFLFAPDARNDDGVLDVVVAGAFDKLGALGILPKVMRGRHVGHPKVHLFQGKDVRLSWARPQHAHAEGEQLTAGTSFHVTLRPAALRVLR